MTPDANAKSLARAAALDARRAMSAVERDAASAIICATIIRSHEFSSCRLLGAYLSMRDEVDVTAVIGRAWRAQKWWFTESHHKEFLGQKRLFKVHKSKKKLQKVKKISSNNPL